MRNGKVFWGVVGLLGLGFVVFNNVDSTIQVVLKNPLKLISLLLSLIGTVVYGIHNRKEIFK